MELSQQDQLVYQEKLLETYDAFNNFCNQNNIRFYAAYGTAIGAVRHNGLIPWDDDIDVFMLEDDYKRFLSLKNKLDGSDYEIVDLDTPRYYCSIAKFLSKKDSIWEYRDLPCMLGAYIDIFPLFTAKGTMEEIYGPFRKYCSNSNLFRLTSLKRSWDTIVEKLIHGKIIKAFIYMLQDVINPVIRPIFLKRIKKGFMVEGTGETYLTSPFEDVSMEELLFKPEWFEDIVLMPFNGREIPMPIGYDAMLKVGYGDYMTPPPVEQRVTHHAHYYFNLEKRVTIEEARKELKK